MGCNPCEGPASDGRATTSNMSSRNLNSHEDSRDRLCEELDRRLRLIRDGQPISPSTNEPWWPFPDSKHASSLEHRLTRSHSCEGTSTRAWDMTASDSGTHIRLPPLPSPVLQKRSILPPRRLSIQDVCRETNHEQATKHFQPSKDDGDDDGNAAPDLRALEPDWACLFPRAAAATAAGETLFTASKLKRQTSEAQLAPHEQRHTLPIGRKGCDISVHRSGTRKTVRKANQHKVVIGQHDKQMRRSRSKPNLRMSSVHESRPKGTVYPRFDPTTFGQKRDCSVAAVAERRRTSSLLSCELLAEEEEEYVADDVVDALVLHVKREARTMPSSRASSSATATTATIYTTTSSASSPSSSSVPSCATDLSRRDSGYDAPNLPYPALVPKHEYVAAFDFSGLESGVW